MTMAAVWRSCDEQDPKGEQDQASIRDKCESTLPLKHATDTEIASAGP